MPSTFTNPILPGGYPDPSICRVGADYYLVNSSFEYFPGLPIHHSTDLVNWELVGYGLGRLEQVSGALNLLDVQTKGGIHAPSLRFHNGLFYLISTNVYLPVGENQAAQFVNFILTAPDAAGPWSMPHVLDGAPGIDPDIFFDDDGRVWYLGAHSPEQPNFPGEGEIWLQEIDLPNWKLSGERHFLWRGACGGVWVEGPHLYKHDGRYYLLVAEGGTSFNHAVMVAASDQICGPYTSNPRNPILTTRHLSYDHWVHSTGHADLVELPDGRWYMVALGIRGDVGRGSNMGRETHLIPLRWEREPFEWQEVKIEWPVCAPETGRVERVNPAPLENTFQTRQSFMDDFDRPALNLEWNFHRAPLPGVYSLTDRPGFLRLSGGPQVFAERSRCSFTGIRQRESEFTFAARLSFQPIEDDQEAGICLFQQDDNYLTFTILRQAGQITLRLSLAEPSKAIRSIQQVNLPSYRGEIILRVLADRQRWRFEYALEADMFHLCAETRSDHILSSGYTGAYLGLYASSNGRQTTPYADFDWVRLEPNCSQAKLA